MSQKRLTYNLRHFEISPATGGGGGFLTRTRKQGYGHRIDLKFATNNGTNHRSKHAKFIGYSTFRGMTSQKFPFQKGMSDRDSIFTPWNRAKLIKSFLCLKPSFQAQNYTPPAFPWFSSKTKKSYVQFFETSHFRENCINPPGESILLKFCQNVSNR